MLKTQLHECLTEEGDFIICQDANNPREVISTCHRFIELCDEAYAKELIILWMKLSSGREVKHLRWLLEITTDMIDYELTPHGFTFEIRQGKLGFFRKE